MRRAMRKSRSIQLRPLLSPVVESRLKDLWLGSSKSTQPTGFGVFLQHLQALIISSGLAASYKGHLYDSFRPDASEYERLVWLICEVLETYRGAEDHSMHWVLQILDEREVIQFPKDRNTETLGELCILLFNIIGWVTLLYVPVNRNSVVSFNIIVPCPLSNLRSSVSMEKAARPIDELLRGFGDLLPKRLSPEPNEIIEPLQLQVSYLNAAALADLGRITIIWEDSIGSHLLFDRPSLSLYLFRLPSICDLQRSQDSILSHFAKGLYIEGEEPISEFNVSDILQEILQSYRLIFGDSRSSRNLYRKRERQKAFLSSESNNGFKVDPLLDEYCGFHAHKHNLPLNEPVKDAYDAALDFPIFRDRLKGIKDHMDGIQPNRLMSLWRDRRDLRLWYTIWTVIFLGVISIIQTTISLILAGLQLRISVKSLELQEKQTP